MCRTRSVILIASQKVIIKCLTSDQRSQKRSLNRPDIDNALDYGFCWLPIQIMYVEISVQAVAPLSAIESHALGQS